MAAVESSATASVGANRSSVIQPSTLTEVQTERVDDIPLLFHTLQQMNLADILDTHVPTHGNRGGLSLGWLTTAWLSYILSEADHRMCFVEGWAAAHQRTLTHLLPVSWCTKDFTDDRLASVLRYFSDDSTWQAVESSLGAHLVRIYDLADEPIRLDATTVSCYHDTKDTELLRVGYSKDSRRDLPQFKLMLATLDPLGLPLATLTVAGNDADDGLYLPAIKEARTVVGQGGRLYIGDAKLSSQRNRATIDKEGDYYLAPLAMSGKIPVLKNQMIDSFLAGKHAWERIESPQQNRCLALGFEIQRSQRVRLDKTPHAFSERVLAVYSPALTRSQRRDLMKRLKAAEAELHPLTLPPASGRCRFNTLQPLVTQVKRILKTHDVLPFISVTYQRHVLRRYVRGRKGKPGRYDEKIFYRIQFKQDNKAIHNRRKKLGWRLYATNAPSETLSLTQAIQLQHASPRIERDFARLKGKSLGIRPLYVQREDHLVGLVRLLSLALRVLTGVEYVVRQRLARVDKPLAGLYAGNPRRTTSTPTTELMLKAFCGITLTEMAMSDGTSERHLTPIKPLQARILRLLGYSAHLYMQLANTKKNTKPSPIEPST